MLASARTFAVEGLHTQPVTVEVDVRPGLPAFSVVGLGDTAVRESRERVQAAIVNCGFEFPHRRITANLAPAHLRKVGPGFDLALACAVLAASGQAPPDRLQGLALFGELSLSGAVMPCPGTLAAAHATHASRLRGLMVSSAGGPEAALVEGLTVLAVDTLRLAVAVLAGADVPPPEAPPAAAGHGLNERWDDLADVRGQAVAVRAALVAAAGGHSLLLSGPPGVGKTMLARRLPSILPPLNSDEALEVTRIRHVAGNEPLTGLVRDRPFRAPHHSITVAGMVGGADPRMPGEVVLAHRGVLFLDELSEFARPALESLRQPLEDGRVLTTRAGHVAMHPTRFILVGATNPCPCGLGPDDDRCRCGEADMARHRRRLSGALLDRMDLRVSLRRPSVEDLRGDGGLDSARGRILVAQARRRQAARTGDPAAVNGQLPPAALSRFARLDAHGEAALATAADRGRLSARARARVLAVARTLADLEGSDPVSVEHVLEALSLRDPAGGLLAEAA